MRYHGIEKYFWAIRENWIDILVCFPIGAAIGIVFSIFTFDFAEILNAAFVCMIGLGGMGAFGSFLDGVIVQAKRDHKVKSETGFTVSVIMFATLAYWFKNHSNILPILLFVGEFFLFDQIVENQIKKLDVEDAIKEAEEKYKIQIEYKNWMQSAGTVRDIADQINLNLQLKEREWHESQKES